MPPQENKKKKLLFFKHVIITDNLQNLRFYQGSSKTMNYNVMFCTKIKLFTGKTVLKVSLFQFFCQCRLLSLEIHEFTKIVNFVILRLLLYLAYLCGCLGQDLFMSYLCELFSYFHFHYSFFG